MLVWYLFHFRHIRLRGCHSLLPIGTDIASVQVRLMLRLASDSIIVSNTSRIRWRCVLRFHVLQGQSFFGGRFALSLQSAAGRGRCDFAGTDHFLRRLIVDKTDG